MRDRRIYKIQKYKMPTRLLWQEREERVKTPILPFMSASSPLPFSILVHQQLPVCRYLPFYTHTESL